MNIGTRVSLPPNGPSRDPQGIAREDAVRRGLQRLDRQTIYLIALGVGAGAVTVTAAFVSGWIEPASLDLPLALRLLAALLAIPLAVEVIARLVGRFASAPSWSRQRGAWSGNPPLGDSRATSAATTEELVARIHARKVQSGQRLSADEILGYRDADRR